MTNIFFRQYVKFSALALYIFIIFQCVFSFFNDTSFLSFYGAVHIFWLASFFITAGICFKSDLKTSFVIILLYQAVAVFLLFSYYVNVINNPLGINPMDASFYDYMARKTSQMDFFESINFVRSTHDVGELGFTQITRLLYMLPGDSVINMKVLNILAQMFSSVFVYKTARLVGFDKNRAKIVFVFFALNPALVFFNASGLKEPFFQLLVSMVIFYSYKFSKNKNLITFTVASILILLTATFRTPYPLFFLFAFSFYFYLSIDGRLKLLYRTVLILLLPMISYLMWVVVSDSVTRILSFDIGAVQSHRLGKDSVGISEYIALVFSGFIGPIPSFSYDLAGTEYPLQTVSNFIKVILSIFFVYSIKDIIKTKDIIYYPLVIVVCLNILMLVLSAATFDLRFFIPMMPAFFLLALRPIDSNSSRKKVWFFGVVIITLLFIVLYNLR